MNTSNNNNHNNQQNDQKEEKSTAIRTHAIYKHKKFEL